MTMTGHFKFRSFYFGTWFVYILTKLKKKKKKKGLHVGGKHEKITTLNSKSLANMNTHKQPLTTLYAFKVRN